MGIIDNYIIITNVPIFEIFFCNITNRKIVNEPYKIVSHIHINISDFYDNKYFLWLYVSIIIPICSSHNIVEKMFLISLISSKNKTHLLEKSF